MRLITLFLLFLIPTLIYAGTGAIPSGPNIKMLKDNIIFKTTQTKIMTGDTDSPTSVAKSADEGSMYIQNGTGIIFQKLDSGSSTNWAPLLIGPAGSGTDECVARWDGTGSPVLQNSIFCITDAGAGTGLTQLTVDSVDINGNTISTTAGNLILSPAASIELTGFTVGSVPFISTGSVLAENNSKLFWDNSLYRLGIGTVTPDSAINISGTAVDDSSIYLDRYATNIGSSMIYMRKARGTEGAPTAVSSGDNLGQLRWFGHNGTSFVDGTYLNAVATENWSVGNTGSKLEIYTRANGGASALSLMIDQDKSTTAYGNIIGDTLTANRAVVTGASKELASSSTTDTQIGYLSTTTSDVQVQLDAKPNRVELSDAQVWIGSGTSGGQARALSGDGTIDRAGVLTLADGALRADEVSMQEIGTSTYDDVRDWADIIQSAGHISGWTITDAGGGTIDISAGVGIIKSTDSDTGQNFFFDLGSTSGFALTDNSVNWIYIDYNAGSPTYAKTTDWSTLDLHTQIIIGNVYREGTSVYISNILQEIDDFSRRSMQHNYEHFGLHRVSGMIIGETGTRNITSTAGRWYSALSGNTSSAFDTSAADTFTAIYQDGIGGWTYQTGQTQINNTNYDDGDGTLGVLTPTRYAVFWVYYSSNDALWVQYGQGNYLLAQAEAASVPSTSPLLSNSGIFIGKIIIQQGASSFTSIETVFDGAQFSFAGVTDHGALAGLGDDDHVQYQLIGDLGDGQMWIGSGVAGAVERSITGDIAIDRGGVAAISNNVIVDTDINTTAGIQWSKMQALTNNSILSVSGGWVTSLGVPTNGQIPIGSTGLAPVLATITGTADQINVSNGAGSITLSTPQSIATTSDVTFNDIIANGDLIASSTTARSHPCMTVTTIQRGSLVPSAGDCIWNSTDSQTQVYNGVGWDGISPATGLPTMAKGSLITSDGSDNGEFTACSDGEIIEWDSGTGGGDSGIKCVTKPDDTDAIRTPGLGTPRIYSVRISSTDTVSYEYTNWINGDCTDADTGEQTCTFETGTFSDVPNCSCSTVGSTLYKCSFSAISAAGFTTVSINTGTSAAVNANTSVICHGYE